MLRATETFSYFRPNTLDINAVCYKYTQLMISMCRQTNRNYCVLHVHTAKRTYPVCGFARKSERERRETKKNNINPEDNLMLCLAHISNRKNLFLV